jgi:predicted double-glycine peptidase
MLEAIATLVLGGLAFRWGMGMGRVLLRSGATANDLFKGRNTVSLLFLGLYVALVVLALNVPQMQVFPLEWRVYGMQVTWTVLRVLLLGFCGLAYVVTWKTARSQVVAVLLLGLLGIGGFTTAEAYFLAPIHQELQDNLQPNGVFRQTSPSSCAPSALATVLRQWGIAATESGIAKLAGTSRLGTSMPQLVVAARESGMEAIELSPTWEQMRRINRPGVLAVWILDGVRKLPHAVALLAMNAEAVKIGDPANGRVYVLTRQQFDRVWRQQYVPIFRPGDDKVTPGQAANFLTHLGYMSAPTGRLRLGIEKFQAALGIGETGNLDSQTVLLLTGPFLQNVPTLSAESNRGRNQTSP